MGHLTLVRHGQASFFGADYDQLSEAGIRQSRALGEHWAANGVRFDTVFVGPRRRHRQTLDGVAAAYRERGLPWPEATEVAELDEHDGLTVIRHVLEGDGTIHAGVRPTDPGGTQRERAVKEFFRRYGEIMRDWARGAVVVPDVEAWPEFRARTLRGLDAMCSVEGRGVAFTSGGAVSSMAGWLLGPGRGPRDRPVRRAAQYRPQRGPLQRASSRPAELQRAAAPAGSEHRHGGVTAPGRVHHQKNGSPAPSSSTPNIARRGEAKNVLTIRHAVTPRNSIGIQG